MDDNIWEYPFGDLDDDDDMFYNKPDEAVTSLPLDNCTYTPLLTVRKRLRFQDTI